MRDRKIGACDCAGGARNLARRTQRVLNGAKSMWTLIIITLLLPNNAGSTGASGAGVTTTMLSFADQQKCLAAAEAVGVPDFAQIPAGATAPVSGILPDRHAMCGARPRRAVAAGRRQLPARRVHGKMRPDRLVVVPAKAYRR
jgi:hypothetical protein